MTDSAEAQAPILAAGGIVVRAGSKPRVAIVRLRRDKAWVLPKGKLNRGERALVAAKREVLEETGHEVSTYEFLGSMSYPVDERIKIVQFWHMRAVGGPVRELTRDVKAVKWLPLKKAIDTLSRAHEKVFLANVGPVVVKAAKQAVRNKVAKPPIRNSRKRQARRTPVVPALHLISRNDAKTGGNSFVRAVGGWIERIMTQPSIRRMG
ncbi:MAG: NUDIX domain-containing protein [Rhizobiales bacterium]|nr:NUDIX domain-containing protein [Hyphomicrobiales bacterium]